MDLYIPQRLETHRDGCRIHSESANHAYEANNNHPSPCTSGSFPSSNDCPDYYDCAGENGPRGENFDSFDASDQFNYYKQRANVANAMQDPWLIALLEDLRELYVRRRGMFKQLFPKLEEEIERRLQEVLASKGMGPVRTMRRSLSVGSPRLQFSRAVGGGDDQPMRLERFKVRTVDLGDEDGVDGGQTVASSGGGGAGK